MNWEAAGAIGEIVSAIGVIGTLIYLSIQIRNSTLESRIAASSEIARDYNSYLQHISSDADLSKLWQTALEDFPSLTREEKTRVTMMAGNMTRILESAYLQYESGRMTNESWNGYEKLLRRGVASSLFPNYWELRKDMHNPAFGKLVEKLLSDPDTRKMFME